MDGAWNKCLEFLAFSCSAKRDRAFCLLLLWHRGALVADPMGLYHRNCCTRKGKNTINNNKREQQITLGWGAQENAAVLHRYRDSSWHLLAAHLTFFMSITRAAEKTKRIWRSLKEPPGPEQSHLTSDLQLMHSSSDFRLSCSSAEKNKLLQRSSHLQFEFLGDVSLSLLPMDEALGCQSSHRWTAMFKVKLGNTALKASKSPLSLFNTG